MVHDTFFAKPYPDRSVSRRVRRVSHLVGARKCVLLLLWIAALLVLAGFGSARVALAQGGGDGETLFAQKCVVCHTVGGGNLVGPDLAGVVDRRDPAWLTQWIAQPDKVLASGDPIATQLLAEFNNIPMPNLGLTEAEVSALIAYLANPGGGAVTAPVVELLAGDPAQGRALFTGASRMANGGPPCMSCHSIAGLGALGGGALGPDLTFSYNTYGGDNGIAIFLDTMPTVTMNAVWTRQPLTPDEQAHLRTFLQEASVQQRPPESVWQLAGLSLAGMILFIAIAHLYWRGRLVSVRKTMVERARI